MTVQADLLFVNIVHRFAVTIIVEVDLDKYLRVLTESVNHVEDHRLLPKGGRLHLKNGDEDFVKQDLDLFLYCYELPSAHEECHHTDLELRA